MAADDEKADDEELVEEFDLQQLEEWAALGEEEEQLLIESFFHLEGQRRLFEAEICEALNQPKHIEIDESGWTRIVDYQWTHQPLSSRGSMLRGGRFNIGRDIDEHQLQHFPALYVGSSHATAYQEYFGRYPSRKGNNGLSPDELALREPSSYSSVQLSVKLQRVFDLTRKSSLKAYVNVTEQFDTEHFTRVFCQLDDQMPISGDRTPQRELTQLLSINWRYFPVNFGIPSPSQTFGRAVRDAQYEGIKYKSTKGPGYCVAVFPDNLMDGSMIEVDSRPPDTSVEYLGRLTGDSFKEQNAPEE